MLGSQLLIRGSWRAVHLSKFDVHTFTSQRKVEVRVKAVLQPEFAEFAEVTRVWHLDQTDPNAKWQVGSVGTFIWVRRSEFLVKRHVQKRSGSSSSYHSRPFRKDHPPTSSLKRYAKLVLDLLDIFESKLYTTPGTTKPADPIGQP